MNHRECCEPIGYNGRALDRDPAGLSRPAPEPGEYAVSDSVWVETKRLTDGSLVHNVWMRNSAPRAVGRGDDRVRFTVEPSDGDGGDPWLYWADAVGFARRIAAVLRDGPRWEVLEG
jgi:hypothetical protein